MLLFGGSLSSPAAKRATDPRGATRDGRGAHRSSSHTETTDDSGESSAPAPQSPRTDVLRRLTNHELRLLEELERTRAKLQAEWRHKLQDAGLSRDHGSSSSASAAVELLAQQLGLPSPTRPEGDLKAAMRSKAPAHKSNQASSLASNAPALKHKVVRSEATTALAAPAPSTRTSPAKRQLPVLRTSLDLLPVLTNSGETPFEIGLDSRSPTTQQQHMLPIFRLPTVNVVATATAMATREVEVVAEDRERQQASEALGLSLHEIAILEAELNGTSSSSREHPSREVQPDRTLPGLREQYKSPQAPRSGQRRARKRKASASSATKQSSEATQTKRSDSLRKELESALSSVQHLTRLVKDDIVLAQKICPANELRTSLYFKRWGRDKVENIFRRLLFNLQGMAFAHWRALVEREKQDEKLQVYLMYKGSKKLDQFLRNWSHRKLRQAWTKWWSDIVHVKAIERLALELDAIRVLQRAWRGYRGRQFASLVKAQRLFARQTAAASVIQRTFRGSVARKFFRLKRLHSRRQSTATKIQACGRGYLAREHAKRIRLERKRFIAASRIQALVRGRSARRAFQVLRRTHRVTKAAVVIQRRYRGRLGRVKFLRRQIERYRGAAATKIQRIARGRIARRKVRDMKAAAAARRALEHAAAIQIQRVYRGHRSRLSTELKLLALREKNRWRAKAATKIQKIMRACLAKKHVSRLREEHVAQLVQLARLWVEYWSEDTSSWFYYNQETGEAIWAPPASGYTKADGNLVLQTGKVIPDPVDGDLSGLVRDRKKPNLAGAKADSDAKTDSANDAARDSTASREHDDDDDDDDDDRLCVECEEEDARRRCEQCEDVFCDACFEKLHRSSKREKHTWKAMGSLRCIECEKMKATRWCYVCQDPYCLGCFTIIHSKGNKVSHEWTDMAAFKRAAKQQQQQQHGSAMREEESAQTYDEFLMSHEYQYVTEFATDESAPAAAATTSYDYSSMMGRSFDAAATGGGGGETEWMTLVDESSGQTYYYNTYTGESRWA